MVKEKLRFLPLFFIASPNCNCLLNLSQQVSEATSFLHFLSFPSSHRFPFRVYALNCSSESDRFPNSLTRDSQPWTGATLLLRIWSMRFGRSIGHRLLALSPSSSPGSPSPDLPPSGTAVSSAISISTVTLSFNLFDLATSIYLYNFWHKLFLRVMIVWVSLI